MGVTSRVRWSDLHDAEAVGAWESLRESGLGETAFSDSSYLEIISAGAGLEMDQAVVLVDDHPAAAVRIPVRRRLGLRCAVIPPLTAYSAVKLGSALKESEVHDRTCVLEPLLEAVEHRFHVAALHLPPEIQDLRTFMWRNWAVRPLYTYSIRLDASRDPVDSWSESARRIARQQSSEFDVVAGDARTQAQLVVESYLRSGRRPPLEEDRLTDVIQSLVDAGAATGHAARSVSSGEIEASVTILRSGSTAYYWAAGGKPGASMTVLLATLLPELATNGIKLFDFVGANTASIAEFKRRFGGRLTTYFRAVWRRGMIGRMLGGGS